jgi:hypothetical protein
MAGCYEDTSVAFTFAFTSSAGFGDGHSSKPVIQVAFAYTTAVPSAPEESEGGKNGELEVGGPCKHQRLTLIRRLRVETIQLSIARGVRKVYESIDDRVLMSLLTHKVLLAIEHEGYREGRLLLQVQRPAQTPHIALCSGACVTFAAVVHRRIGLLHCWRNIKYTTGRILIARYFQRPSVQRFRASHGGYMAFYVVPCLPPTRPCPHIASPWILVWPFISSTAACQSTISSQLFTHCWLRMLRPTKYVKASCPSHGGP